MKHSDVKPWKERVPHLILDPASVLFSLRRAGGCPRRWRLSSAVEASQNLNKHHHLTYFDALNTNIPMDFSNSLRISQIEEIG